MIILTCLVLAIPAYSAKKFHASVGANYLFPGDAGYKAIYGKKLLYPEINLGYSLFKNVYVWTGYGFLKGDGAIVGTYGEITTKTDQHYLYCGFGYRMQFIGSIRLNLEPCLFYLNYKETVLGDEAKGSVIGYGGNCSLVFNLGRTLFYEMKAGYLFAEDTVAGVTVKPGGFKMGVSLGIRF
ncbi:MAG: hypothetical protein GY757_20005 [bacterium]|nr:hypothetical protein [bacterium]